MTEYNREPANDKHAKSVVKIISWNIRGASDKLSDQDLQEYLFQHDIIVLYETMKGKDWHVDIPGFTFTHFPRKTLHPRTHRASGGIGIFVRNNLMGKIKINNTLETIVWIKLKSSLVNTENDVCIGCIYMPPEGSSYVIDTCCPFTDLQEEISKIQCKNIFLCGDFNARVGSLLDYDNGSPDELPGNAHWLENFLDTPKTMPRQSVDNTVNKYGKNLIDMCKSSNLYILNGRIQNTNEFTCYTSNGKSVVDYLLTSVTDLDKLEKFELHPKRAESDHCPLVFEINCDINERYMCRETQIQCDNPNTWYKYKWDPTKVNQYLFHMQSDVSENLKGEFICSLTENNNVDMVCERFYNYLKFSLDATFKKIGLGKRKKKFPCNVWFDTECKQLKSQLNQYTKQNDISVPDKWEEYTKLERNYKRVLQSKKRCYKYDNLAEFQDLCSNNPDDYWKFWKSLKRNCNRNTDSIDIDTFANYYKSLNEAPVPDYFEDDLIQKAKDCVEKFKLEIVQCQNEVINDILSRAITPDEVLHQLHKLKSGKACGVDGIGIEFLKCVSGQVTSEITALFNYILDNGEYPELWSEGIINPIHKTGTMDNPDHYRKITVMCALGKLFEAVLNNRLHFKNDVFSDDDPFQFGFAKNCRTTDNVFILSSLIEKQKFKGEPLFTSFVDFSKAFDTVNRYALIYKLTQRGINGAFIKVLISMFEKAKCKIKWDSRLSDPILTTAGVLQGGMISPKLFTEFLSDIGQYLDSTSGVVLGDLLFFYLLFADDLILCSNTAAGLQKQLDGLFDFCRKWHMVLNLPKTKVLVFNKRHCTDKFYYNGSEIDHADSYKYLGVWFRTTKYDYLANNREYLVEQANKALYQVYKVSGPVVGKLSPDIAFKVFDTQLMPILEYGSEIWFCDKESQNASIEKFHLKFIKSTLGVRPQTPTNAVYAETGRVPLYLRHHIKALKYWVNILNLTKGHPVKQAYNALHSLDSFGQKNWCTKIRILLWDLGFTNVWEHQHVENGKLFIKNIWDSMQTTYKNKNIEVIKQSGHETKLRTYKLFKDTFCLEPYLHIVKDSRYRTALTRLRLSSHKLSIETGRHVKPKIPVNSRLCENCNLQEIEDEVHFLLVCPKYTRARETLLHEFSKYIPDLQSLTLADKFKYILQCQEQSALVQLGKYLYENSQGN